MTLKTRITEIQFIHSISCAWFCFTLCL